MLMGEVIQWAEARQGIGQKNSAQPLCHNQKQPGKYGAMRELG